MTSASTSYETDQMRIWCEKINALRRRGYDREIALLETSRLVGRVMVFHNAGKYPDDADPSLSEQMHVDDTRRPPRVRIYSRQQRPKLHRAEFILA